MNSQEFSGNIVVLIDQYTRKQAEVIAYDALSKHATVITDIREVNDAHYNCDLVIFEPAIPALITPEILREVVANYSVRVHLLCTVSVISDMFHDCARCVDVSSKEIEWNLIYAVVNEDLAVLEPYQRKKKEPLEFAELLENLPAEFASPVNRMYLSYLELAKECNKLINENSEANERIKVYDSICKKSIVANSELRQLLQEATDTNRTYSAMLSESYDTTFSGIYSERPRVLYIKTVSHLSGIDNLLMVLYSVLTKQYKVSCKIVKLMDSTNAPAVRYVPNVYTPLADSYNTAEVLVNDFLMTLGGFNMLFGLLMLNRSGLDFLIVHDMRGTLNNALDPALVDLTLHEMSGDYAVLGEYENTLSDIESSANFVWNFSEVSQYTGSNTTKLTNHPTVTKILDYLM